jgi:transposase-like protein
MSGRETSPQDKLAAAIAALRGDIPRAELENKYGVSRQSILSWAQKLERHGQIVFCFGDPVAHVQRLEAQIRHLQRKVSDYETELTLRDRDEPQES